MRGGEYSFNRMYLCEVSFMVVQAVLVEELCIQKIFSLMVLFLKLRIKRLKQINPPWFFVNVLVRIIDPVVIFPPIS